MKGRAGFTLVEILIAMTVLVIGMVGILALFPVGLNATRNAIEDSQAALIAESAYASLRTAVRKLEADSSGAPGPYKYIRYFHDGVITSDGDGTDGTEDDNLIYLQKNDSGIKKIICRANVGYNVWIPNDTSPPLLPNAVSEGQIHLAKQDGESYNIHGNSSWIYDARPIGGKQMLDQYSFNIELRYVGDPEGLYDVIIRVYRGKGTTMKLAKKFYTQVTVPLPLN